MMADQETKKTEAPAWQTEPYVAPEPWLTVEEELEDPWARTSEEAEAEEFDLLVKEMEATATMKQPEKSPAELRRDIQLLERRNARLAGEIEEVKAMSHEARIQIIIMEIAKAVTPALKAVGVTKPAMVAKLFAQSHPDFKPNRKGAGLHVLNWARSVGLAEEEK
jgi:hypothetical protein